MKVPQIFRREQQEEINEIQTIDKQISDLAEEIFKVDGKIRFTEYPPDKQVLIDKKRELEAKKDRLEKRKKELQRQQDQEWHKTNLTPALRDIRYCADGNSVTFYRNGLIEPHMVKWTKLKPDEIESLSIPIVTNTGRKLRFDLKWIHKKVWQDMMRNPYNVYAFPIETMPATRKGKPVGIWQSGEETFQQRRQIKLNLNPTYILFWRV